MLEQPSAPSDGASEGIATPTPDTGADTGPASSPSTREALERAFTSTGEPGTSPDRGDGRDSFGRYAGQAKAGLTAQPGDGATSATSATAPAAAPGAVPAPAGTDAAPAPVAPGGPPARFTKAAQEAWAGVPETVRAEVARMETELVAGIEKYRAAYEPVRQFDEMARQGGTTLDKALANFVGLENQMRRDPIAGTFQIFSNLGVDKAGAVRLVNAMAERLGLRRADGQGQAEAGQADPRDQHIARLEGQIQQLGGHVQHVGRSLQQQQQERLKGEVLNGVDAFAAQNPRFEELSSTIAEMLETKFAKDLPDAYAKAERMHGPLAAAPVPSVPGAHTPKAALTPTGSPTNGSNPSARKPAGSTREALQAAFAQVGAI